MQREAIKFEAEIAPYSRAAFIKPSGGVRLDDKVDCLEITFVFRRGRHEVVFSVTVHHAADVIKAFAVARSIPQFDLFEKIVAGSVTPCAESIYGFVRDRLLDANFIRFAARPDAHSKGRTTETVYKELFSPRSIKLAGF